MPPLDPDVCYAASASRDARFDGTFVVAVRTTGIYCRPSCPAITPKRTNVEFHRTAAAAQQRGFRACKRCRPDATPGSPEWNVRHDVVGRAMRLIADGTVERIGVPGLASTLGYSERHLNRVLSEEVGAGPLALARAQRAQTARVLIETTDLRLTDVAFAAGFGSVRQFNDTMRQVFASSPSELRSAAQRRFSVGGVADGGAACVTLRLPTRPPFAVDDVLAFLGDRALSGVETFRADHRAHEHAAADHASPDDVSAYRRVIEIDGRHGVVAVHPSGGPAADRSSADDDDCGPDGDGRGTDHVVVTIRLAAWSDLGTAVQRVRRMLDLDADPTAIDAHLAAVPALRELVRRTPGRRSPASVDPFETLIRAIVGQQVSVAGARTVAGRLVAAAGARVSIDGESLTHAFPTPAALADAPDAAFSMPAARRDAIRRAAAAVADGTVRLDVGVDPDEARHALLALRGVGPWTADYVLMRGIGHPDVALDTDLGVVQALRRLGVANATSEVFDGAAPWRSYAVHHLWASLAIPPSRLASSRLASSRLASSRLASSRLDSRRPDSTRRLLSVPATAPAAAVSTSRQEH